MISWREEDSKEFQEKTESIDIQERKNDEVEERSKDMKEIIESAVVKLKKK